MSTIIKSVTISAPHEQVWPVLADLGGIHRWNPGVRQSYSTSEASGGPDASRHCDLEPRGRLEERVAEWRDGQGYTIEVYETNLPLATNLVRFDVQPRGEGETEVTLRADYRLKYGPVGLILDSLFARQQFERGFSGLLAGLKHHVETGEVVDGDATLPESATAAIT